MTKIQKVVFTGKTHTTASRSGATTHSDEENVNLELSSPTKGSATYVYNAVASHPTAEQLFAGAWSACYMSAIRLAAGQKKVALPADVSLDFEVDVGTAGDAFLLQARLNVTLPGMARDQAETLAHAAHEICPYSKATRGNIDVSLMVATA